MIRRITTGLTSRLRRIILAAGGVRFDGRARINRIEIAGDRKFVRLGNEVALDNGVALIAHGEIQIGAHAYVNRYTIIDAQRSITIGSHCMIGPHCYISDSNHGTDIGEPVTRQPIESEAVELGDGVWIGANVNILAGVTIGDGAVIGAGSVVTRDIPANCIAAGTPAREIRRRA